MYKRMRTWLSLYHFSPPVSLSLHPECMRLWRDLGIRRLRIRVQSQPFNTSLNYNNVIWISYPPSFPKTGGGSHPTHSLLWGEAGMISPMTTPKNQNKNLPPCALPPSPPPAPEVTRAREPSIASPVDGLPDSQRPAGVPSPPIRCSPR